MQDEEHLTTVTTTTSTSAVPQLTSPMLVKHTTRIIDGILTEVMTQSFSDRILILITQLGKVGTLVCQICGFSTFISRTSHESSQRP